jgi:putative methionine-R-sulfoxide reductase with GAF domain
VELNFFQWLLQALGRISERTPWLVVFVALLLAAYLITLVYKILSAEEGFVLGYKGWVLGKWIKPPRRISVGRSTQGFPLRRLRQEKEELEASGRIKREMILLTRLLDADLAYLMANERVEWESGLRRLVQILVSGVARIVRVDSSHRCGFFIREDDGAHLVLSVGEGYQGPVRLPVDFSCAGRAFQTGETYYCRDLLHDPIWNHVVRGRAQYRSVACVPVRAAQVLWGVLCVEAEEPEAFTRDDLLCLEMYAAKLAVICSLHSLQISGICKL